MKIFDERFTALERSLDVHFKRQLVLTGNLANSETPNYRARELDFAGELQRALGKETTSLARTNSRHIDVSELSGDHVVFDNSGAMGADGNNVDLDITLGKISANARAYEQAASLMSQKFKMIRTFIRRGGA